MSTLAIALPQVKSMLKCFDALSAYLRQGQTVAVIGGQTALSKTETQIRESLANWSPSFTVYGKECTQANISRLAELPEIRNADILIGVGGGKALDTAKAVADQLDKPILTIPTIASTCAATSAISVIYNEDHAFEELRGLKRAPLASFLPMEVIAQAPVKYIWAGIGDTLAKPVEIEFSVRGKALSIEEALAKQISQLCIEQCLLHGEKAIENAKMGRVSEALEQTAFTIIVTTGYASCLIAPELSGSLAHSLNNALTQFEIIEKEHLHGEVVAFGVLVLCTIDAQVELIKRLRPLYKAIGLPTKLSQLGIQPDRGHLGNLLRDTVSGEEMRFGAYQVDEEQLFKALTTLETV